MSLGCGIEQDAMVSLKARATLSDRASLGTSYVLGRDTEPSTTAMWGHGSCLVGWQCSLVNPVVHEAGARLLLVMTPTCVLLL